ncbi:MAG TPA: class I SAM-dependent methyltransferase [Candidatus Portnoybacteria bacterium]|mgnify:FL=1|nr:class I SAM-dependent methyltransferase [Candidatus Portnoybacteria bacterium]HPM28421.1 class I SAM-dependent methyltransferase [Candidatus Portnoybacteria bacterium]
MFKNIIKNIKLKFYFLRRKFYRLFRTKKQIEMEAQRKRAKDMASPQIRDKVNDYFNKFRFLQEIIKITGINDNSEILDIGCGIKTVLHFLPGKIKIGVDSLADEYIKIYDYPKDIKIEKSFGENLKFKNNSFDVVFMTNALDHTKNPQKVVSEIFRVLRSGGYFALTNELVKKDFKRDKAHPNNLQEQDISELLSGKFNIVFKRFSAWFGLRQYYLGLLKEEDFKNNNQIIILAQKI